MLLAKQAAQEEALHPGSTIVPLRGYKRAMVKSMVAAGAIPHFHLCDELDMRALMALRNQIKGDSVLQGVHLTFLPVMIKVSFPPVSPPSGLALALQRLAQGVMHCQHRPQQAARCLNNACTSQRMRGSP